MVASSSDEGHLARSLTSDGFFGGSSSFFPFFLPRLLLLLFGRRAGPAATSTFGARLALAGLAGGSFG